MDETLPLHAAARLGPGSWTGISGGPCPGSVQVGDINLTLAGRLDFDGLHRHFFCLPSWLHQRGRWVGRDCQWTAVDAR
jgi:hypothetical protein